MNEKEHCWDYPETPTTITPKPRPQDSEPDQSRTFETFPLLPRVRYTATPSTIARRRRRPRSTTTSSAAVGKGGRGDPRPHGAGEPTLLVRPACMRPRRPPGGEQTTRASANGREKRRKPMKTNIEAVMRQDAAQVDAVIDAARRVAAVVRDIHTGFGVLALEALQRAVHALDETTPARR